MKTMKVLAKVFAIVGLVADIALFLYALIAFIVANATEGEVKAAFLTLAIIYGLFSAIGIFVGIKILSSLSNDDKAIYLGVLGIIFLSLVGGIFYLIWTPYNTTSSSGVDPFINIFGEDYKERRFEPFDKVSILDECSSVQPKINKGQIGYVIVSDKSDRPCEKRFTKVLFLRDENNPEIYYFHNFVFKKVGELKEDYNYSESELVVGKTMKLNHDFKGIKTGDEVYIKKVFIHKYYKLLNKAIVEHTFVKPNNKARTIRRKVFAFYLTD